MDEIFITEFLNLDIEFEELGVFKCREISGY